MKHARLGALLTLLALQGACSLLIEVKDGEGELSIDGGSNQADVAETASGGASGAAAAGAAGTEPGAAGAAGTEPVAGSPGPGGFGGGSSAVAHDSDAGPLGPDAGWSEPYAGRAPTFDLAFIEQPEEELATLQIVSTELALAAPQPDLDPSWKRTLRSADAVGGVLDFAWSPDGASIAARFVTARGPQIAIFRAPDWEELPRTDAGLLATLPELEATANYRWAPGSDGLAVELGSDDGPMLCGYVLDADGAFGLQPVAFTGVIETMDFRSASSLYVIQSQSGQPELIELRLNGRAFEPPRSVLTIGLFLPLALRHVPGGVISASADPGNFLLFWPESDDGADALFLPSSYLSAGQSFVAEGADTPEALIYPIGDSASFVTTLPDCPTVLAWSSGPERGSLAGSKLACLALADASAKITIHAFDANGQLQSTLLDDGTLSADLASTDGWEAHARGFSSDGDFLALASNAHDFLVDLSGPSPQLRITDSAAPGNTAYGFSPSGRVLLQQRGRRIDFVRLASGLPREQYTLPEAPADLAACLTAHHTLDWCGAPSAARRAAARWSLNSDVAAVLAAGEGLSVLAAVPQPFGIVLVPISSCGASCITQYEFGR